MSDERDPKAGTTETHDTGDDAAKAALAESEREDDRDAGDGDDEASGKRVDWKALHLTLGKPALEKVKALEAELAELRQKQRADHEPPTPDPQQSQDLAKLERFRKAVAAAQRMKDNGDELADLALINAEDNLRIHQERMLERQATALERANSDYLADAEVVGEDGEARPLNRAERRELSDFYEKNKGVFRNIEAAHDALLGRKYREELKTLTKAKRQVVEDERRREREGVISSGKRDVGAGEVKARRMTEAAYQAELKRAVEADDGSDYRLKKDRLAGRIVVT